MSRWFFRSGKAKRATAQRGAKPSKRVRVRNEPAKTRTRRRDAHPPAPLTWSDPDQDFITRYGDPFDG
jgi:hypothetical protein